jgi:hypothetical protein
MFTRGQHIKVTNACEVGLDYLPLGLQGTVVEVRDVLGTPILVCDFSDGRRVAMREEEIEEAVEP